MRVFQFSSAVFICVIIAISCTSNKRYPCPAYDNKTSAQFDSSGAFTGGSRSNRDKKTGLIKKKKDKRIMDRKSKASLF
jgi:hypothetical protein